jgi:hypothetical protein
MTNTIQIRTNLYLWLLTGRSEGFFSPALNSGVNYHTDQVSANVVAARELLKLGDTRTDFYVLGALASAYMSMPLLRDLPDDRGLAFVEDLVLLPPMDVTGATMLPVDGTSWPHLDGRPAGAAGFTAVTILRDGAVALVTRDDGFSARVSYTVAGDILSVDGMAAHGIHSNFSASAWMAGQPIVVRLSPARYPYAEMARKAADSSEVINLLASEGMMEAFATSNDALRKVGAVCAAIMRSAARVVSSDQASVSIVVTDTDGALVAISNDQPLYFEGAALLYGGDGLTYTT